MQYVDGKPVAATQIVALDAASRRDLLRMTCATSSSPISARRCRRWITERPSGTSTRPANSSSAVRTATAGLTGRKIIVDTYGGAAPHGGGAFSGKDPTKVDRSAAYAARYLAKNIVAAGLADRCTIQLAYAIGFPSPCRSMSIRMAPAASPEEKLELAVPQIMRLSPRGIRDHLQLNRPIYARTAAYGHFGRAPEAEGGFSWEKTDLVDKLRASFN